MTGDLRRDAKEIFMAGLAAADPEKAVRQAVAIDADGHIAVNGVDYDLKGFKRIFVVGVGKAASRMAYALEEEIGDYISEGTVTTKYGYGISLKIISLAEAGHPVPDEAGIAGTKRIIELLEKAGEGDLVFCLISGGGSSLMPFPAPGISLSDKQKTTRELLACGATIHEINTIRKHISMSKGGRLAKFAYPATLVSLVLSDVVGDDLDVIASGPTVPDKTTFSDCIKILEKYDLFGSIPKGVVTYLENGVSGINPETPKPKDPVFGAVNVCIIGSIGISVEAAANMAKKVGYNTLILSSFIEGETKDVAKVHCAIIKEVFKSGNPVPKPACIISGGETTVTLKGDGLGGRNTEFVLVSAIEIDELEGVAVLSGGTDGTDGPTDAAGAIADGTTVHKAEAIGLDPVKYLANNDSYHFFKATGDLLITGPTMTNVMDLRILLIA